MRVFFQPDDIDLKAFADLCKRQTDSSEYPSASNVVENIVVYEGSTVRSKTGSVQDEAKLKSEFVRCLKSGPGVFVIRQMYDDLSVIKRTNEIFRRIVDTESASGQIVGDHFGDNERIWNSMQKVAIADPDLFVEYYGNSILRLASEAWLGPGYRVTAQMNNVKPGGKAQAAHRDYHLGFQSADTVAQFPAHAQIMSQYLTLQGAIAHCDMPTDKGPTMLLPFSHHFGPGYMAYRSPVFLDYFNHHQVQIPLRQGDAIFFNPALFHAGGANTTSSDRIANLVQVSSAFGRTMETIDHLSIIEAVYPVLRKHKTKAGNTNELISNIVSVATDGYSFPTNLDTDPPIDGNSPETQQHLLTRALDENWAWERLKQSLAEYENRRR